MHTLYRIPSTVASGHRHDRNWHGNSSSGLLLFVGPERGALQSKHSLPKPSFFPVLFTYTHTHTHTRTYTHTHLQSLVLPVHVLVHQFDCMQHLGCLAPWISGHSRHRGREDVPAPSVPQTPPTSTCGLQGNKTAGGGALPI